MNQKRISLKITFDIFKRAILWYQTWLFVAFYEQKSPLCVTYMKHQEQKNVIDQSTVHVILITDVRIIDREKWGKIAWKWENFK